jgi:CHAD domain-containing protein/HD superfamily phosphodiesterase
VPSAIGNTNRAKKVTGLRYWMLRVLEECDNVAKNFDPDPVHDLRVSLRRCRSMADGLIALDPDPAWRAMRKAGKGLFQRLGDLRDTHVMIEFVEKLEPNQSHGNGSQGAQGTENSAGEAGGAAAEDHQDPVAQALIEILRGREKEQKLDAHAALEEFDRKQWRHWSKSLPGRAGRIRPGSALFKHLALERWTAARELHAQALRNRSQAAFHRLRIGLKKFRYVVENFLPAEHNAWSNDLKEMQDLLGEVHDLDVLWSTAVTCRVFPDAESRSQWHERILAERAKRIEHYCARMIGENSLWHVWRAALPDGKQIQSLATRRMKHWAHGLDPDFAHSERVTRLALQLYDGMLAWGWKPPVDADSARSSLSAAALLHDVGKAGGQKGHHKVSFDMIRAHGSPLGWNAADLQRAAIVARFHRGALPTRRHKTLRDLLPDEQKAAIQLAAILRLANALDATHDGHIRELQVVETTSTRNGFQRKGRAGLAPTLVIAAQGYRATSPAAQTIAGERHLLETVLHRPVVIRPARRV